MNPSDNPCTIRQEKRCSSSVVGKKPCQTVTAAFHNVFNKIMSSRQRCRPPGLRFASSLSCLLQLLPLPHGSSLCLPHRLPLKLHAMRDPPAAQVMLACGSLRAAVCHPVESAWCSIIVIKEACQSFFEEHASVMCFKVLFPVHSIFFTKAGFKIDEF